MFSTNFLNFFSKNPIKSLTCSVDINSYNRLEEIRKENIPNLYFAYGLYPDVIFKKSIKEYLEDLNRMDFSKAIAIGEIGLDYKITKDKTKREEQKRLLEKQLEIAKEFKKPVILHTRYATKPTLEIIKSWTDLKIILHWFNGTEKEIQEALDRGYYLTQRFGRPEIPNIKDHLDNIFIETDYPVPYNGKEIQPLAIKESYTVFCEKYQLDLEKIKERMENNFTNLLKSIPRF